MDREIDPKERWWNIIRRTFMLMLAAAALWAVIVWGFGLIRPSIRLSMVRTSVVDVGPVDATLSATGTVVPEIEQVFSSPVDARVLKISKRAGAIVKRGESLLQLDVNASLLTADKLDQDVALKANQQARAKLVLENTLAELNSQVEIKRLQQETVRLEHDRNRQLFEQGLQSQQILGQSEVAEAQAGIELKRLEASRQNAQAATRAELDGLTLEMSKLQKDQLEARRVLELATTRADRDGVLTWSLTEEGATIRKGDVVARLADLSSFRVDASVSDSYANRIRAGMPVQVRVDDTSLPGRVATVLPAVKDGTVTVIIALDDRSSSLLRPNLRVEVFIVTGHRDRALRVRKGVSTGGEGYQQVFVVRGDQAGRTRVRFGLASFDYIEVVEGLREGDQIIVSDMTDYQHLTTIRLH